MNKTDITPAMETQAPVTTPAQDIFGACAELAAFSGHVTTDQWDTLRRVIATLRGVADRDRRAGAARRYGDAAARAGLPLPCGRGL